MENNDNDGQAQQAQSKQHPWYGGMEFRTLAESIPALVFVSDANGANIYSNAQFPRYTGMDADEILGDGWLKAIHPDDRERAAATWLESWTKGAEYDTKYRFRRFDGEYRWHIVRGAPVTDGNDNIVRWIGSCTDVEDLIAHISVQTQAEKILEALAKASNLIVYAKDANGAFIYSNEAVNQTISQKPRAVLGKTAEDLAVEDQEGKAIEENDALVKTSGEPHTVLEQWTLAGAETRHFRSTKVPLPLPDGSVGIAALSVDMTATVSLQEKYEEALAHTRNRIDTIPIVTWVSDENGDLIEVNQAWHDHAGFVSALKLDFNDVIAPEAKAKFFDHWQFCVESGQILDIDIELRDELAQKTVTRRALGIPMDRTESGVNKRFWYGTFS
ncbi:PAS domain-containing protein [Parasphingorhabdus cellanae]|uniref:histidine kinase n=1 Tax=Parasphingorhabdus cellanae TaxID=2806553 RepID=A0ABX7T4F5_9SPHN|nr:PAS domain-containing protein [Parasphingorhabdus cellanae]QTD56466.1 PAS domain-containing protein [Parasphingorhabdus cellanae]